MYIKQEIVLKCYREGASQRQISRELNISRKTVRKYIEAYQSEASTSNKEVSMSVFTLDLTTPPLYHVGQRAKRCLTEGIITAIDIHLSDNALKVSQGFGKQILKKIDIFESLQREGHQISYSTLCNYIREKLHKQSFKEAYIRQVYEPGVECEFDWAEIKLSINGTLGRYYMAVFTSSYSNYRYSLIFERQDTLAFVESHIKFFSHLGGVYQKMTYDNMRVAVARFVGRHEKEPTAALLQMRGHYLFSHRFCNAYSGNEKGHVERSVEYVRRKAFGREQSFSSLDEAQQHLDIALEGINKSKQQLTGRSANDMLADERPMLHKVAAPLSFSDSHQLRVNKYSAVCFGTNYYSVPDHLVEALVDVKIHSRKIEIYYHNTLVATHDRCFGRHQWIISIEHYLATFTKKPGALRSSVALISSPYLKDLYQRYYQDAPREFIDLLKFCVRFKVAQSTLEKTVNQLISMCTHKISTEQITAIIGNKPPLTALLPADKSETATHSIKLLTQITAILN